MCINFCVLSKWKNRIDIFLTNIFSDYSRSYIQKIIDRWDVKLNWISINKNLKISYKDEICISIVYQKYNIEAEDKKLEIIFENNDLILVNKDAWINVHPVPWEWWDKNTLLNRLLFHCKDLAIIWWVERPGIVHRIDKDTSWVLIVAKNDKMMNYLSSAFKERKVTKYYYAIVDWLVTDKKFRIESYIWRDPNNRLRMTSKNPLNPKIALSNWELIAYIDNKYSLLKINIETWRTHQIRVHLASIYHPIVWDKLYWDSKINMEVFKKYKLDRQALHAYKLELDIYWEKYSFTADLKEDMKKFIGGIIL